MENLKLGVLGISEGNGHPYSWSAVFNGYNEKYMKDCPFPVIYDYLSKQKFPEDAISGAAVTHVWTQDVQYSEHIAKSSNIDNIVKYPEEMISSVDAILLARDDYENHYEMALPFIRAGLPIFIDKPLALSVEEAKTLFKEMQYENQIFTCSSIKYAKEFGVDKVVGLGEIKFIEAIISKSWEKYAIHIVEPVLDMIPNRGGLLSVQNTGYKDVNIVTVSWENVTAVFSVVGNNKSPLEMTLYGSEKWKRLSFEDTFYAFKESLKHFIKGVKRKSVIIPRQLTLDVIEIVEKGIRK